MKKFLKISVVVGVVVLSISTAFAGGDRRDDRRDDRRTNNRYRSYPYDIGDRGPGAIEVGRPREMVGVLAQTPPFFSVFGTVIVGGQPGHWENRIVGYQTVMRPVYHPPVLGTYWNGYQMIQYVQITEWTEMVPIQEPVYQRIWVSP
ncbi:MAG: hypothetical protein WCC74_00325 [Minisyncoccia bacterium]